LDILYKYYTLLGVWQLLRLTNDAAQATRPYFGVLAEASSGNAQPGKQTRLKCNFGSPLGMIHRPFLEIDLTYQVSKVLFTKIRGKKIAFQCMRHKHQ